MPTQSQTVAAVILAYSRFDLLKRLVDAVRCQTRRPDEIIVVYQGKDPEIEAWVDSVEDCTVIKQDNLGSAGGFCRGLEESIHRGHHWTWFFDDDAIPEPGALEELVTRPYFGLEETAFLGSRIIDRHGKTYMSPGGQPSGQDWYGTVLEDRCVGATDACWLGLLVSTRAVREVGLPIAEYFLWDEDREFVSRLSQAGKGYCALDSVITHYQTDAFDPFGADYFKLAYFARNHIAGAKVGPASIPRKVFRTAKRGSHFCGQILKRKAPIKLVRSIFTGTFLFWPKVRYVDESEEE